MLLLGSVTMNAVTFVRRLTGALIATLLGTTFFFAIIGVFGLPAAIVALTLFIALALLVFRRPQTKGTRS